jgi:hypothetical protein
LCAGIGSAILRGCAGSEGPENDAEKGTLQGEAYLDPAISFSNCET